MSQCPKLFIKVAHPPPNIKESWIKMVPEWAWKAMVNDTEQILDREIPRKSPNEDIERMIKNRHVFIRREAFLPDIFLPDIVEEACKKRKSK